MDLSKKVEQFHEIDFISKITKKLLQKNEQKFIKICKEFFKYVNGKKYNEDLYKRTYKHYNNINNDNSMIFEKIKKYYFSQKKGFIDEYKIVGDIIFRGANDNSFHVLSINLISIIAYCYTYKLDFPKVFHENSKNKLIKDDRDICEKLRFGEKTQRVNDLYFNGEIFYHIKKNKNMYKNPKKNMLQFHKLNREFPTYNNQYDVVDDEDACEIVKLLEINAFERKKEENEDDEDDEEENEEEDHTETFEIAENEFYEDYVPSFIDEILTRVYPKIIHFFDDLKFICDINQDNYKCIDKIKENLKYFQEKNIECCICLEKNYKNEYIKLNCNHFFHNKCMLSINKCPLCRKRREYENYEIFKLDCESLYNPITKYYDTI